MILFLLWILPSPLNIWCPTVQIIWIARRCLIYAESKLSAPNRPCSCSLIIPPSRLQNFCMFLSSALNVMTIVMNRTQRQKLPLAAKREPPTLRLILCVGFSCTMYDKKAWQLRAVAQLRLDKDRGNALWWYICVKYYSKCAEFQMIEEFKI